MDSKATILVQKNLHYIKKSTAWLKNLQDFVPSYLPFFMMYFRTGASMV